MKTLVIFLGSIFLMKSLCACQMPEDGLRDLTRDKEGHEAWLEGRRARFDQQFSSSKTEFERRIEAIEKSMDPKELKIKYLPAGYFAFEYQPNGDCTLLGVISSERQLELILGERYHEVLVREPSIIYDYFKAVVLQDQEEVILGAFLLGTWDVKQMLALINQDIKNDYIKMTQQAYQRKKSDKKQY